MSYRQELHDTEMKSTDPSAAHRWRITHHPVGADPYVHADDVAMTDAQIEAIADDAGERAAITYAREVPWQDGRRHATRLDLRAREGEGSFVYERTDDRNEVPEYRITRTSLHDLRIPADILNAPAEELAGHLAVNLGPQTSRSDYFVILAPRGGELIRPVGPKTSQAPQVAAARISDLRYRLAAIERLIAHVASSSEDRTASLVASAVHEIARGARTPEDAVANLLPPDWSTALSGLTR